ncbi:MAG: beta-lactamase domain protein [Acidobacteriaceae bacterium]|nr:beta-lactamase domain protein [Acidobacteriaceae bacterium]
MMNTFSPSRRCFIRKLMATSASLSISPLVPWGASAASVAYEPWKPGMLDVHHISTGCGNSTLILCPDGTTMMVDAGAIYVPLEYTIAPKPDNSRRPGEWLARYAMRHLRAADCKEIDYFVLTHFHADHMGEVTPELPRSRYGDYHLTGVSDVAEILPIRRFIDRNYPSYDYPLPLNDAHQTNYIRFIQEQVRRGASAQRIQVGSSKQISLLRNPEAYPSFSVRNLGANGEVWSGTSDTTKHQFPDLTSLSRNDYPTENMCSLALRLSYGQFDYYTGGDLSNSTDYAMRPGAILKLQSRRLPDRSRSRSRSRSSTIMAMPTRMDRALSGRSVPRCFSSWRGTQSTRP